MDGMSLAEELSAFLYDSSASDDGGSQSESSGYSPEKKNPASNKSKNFSSRVQPEHEPTQSLAPKTSSSMKGLNPLYAMTQPAPDVPHSFPTQPVPNNTLKQSTHMPQQHLPSQPLAPGVIPSRALKPVTSLNSSRFPSEQSSYKSVNGFQGHGVILEPTRPNEFVPIEGRKGDTPTLQSEVSKLNMQKNGSLENRFVTPCADEFC